MDIAVNYLFSFDEVFFFERNEEPSKKETEELSFLISFSNKRYIKTNKYSVSKFELNIF